MGFCSNGTDRLQKEQSFPSLTSRLRMRWIKLSQHLPWNLLIFIKDKKIALGHIADIR
jgi:hypothetical protein